MDNSKIFIVGANGQLGKALKQQYPQAQSADINELDITNKESVETYDWSNIEVILNAAAYTNVDRAETDDGRMAAWNVNAVAVGNLATLALTQDLTFVHISTAYVFDAPKALPSANEPPTPIQRYRSHKASGGVPVSLEPHTTTSRAPWRHCTGTTLGTRTCAQNTFWSAPAAPMCA